MYSFIGYQPPSIRHLLILGSFLFLLQVIGIAFDALFRCGMVGQMLLGAIYGAPLTGLLSIDWQEAFLACGYLGLILLVFEGGLSTDLNLLTRNLSLSIICALTGIITPIALSILWLTKVFGYTVAQAFVAGASLSATSLGTTIAILRASDKKSETTLFQSAVATVLMTAAILDDIAGLITASIISGLGSEHHSSIGWIIGRPILASGGLLFVIFMMAQTGKYLPFSEFTKKSFVQRYKIRIGISITLGTLAAVSAAATYAGTSTLFGAFTAGLLLSYAISRSEENAGLDFRAIFPFSMGSLQETLLLPLFFASIGFSIPFRNLWKGEIVWKGIVYSVIMMVGKMVVGVWIPVWSFLPRKRDQTRERGEGEPNLDRKRYPALFLGAGMVARGEIGLLICQVGFNSGSGPLPSDLFEITIWALIVNTVVGPMLVALVLRRWEAQIKGGRWGNAPPIVTVHNRNETILSSL